MSSQPRPLFTSEALVLGTLHTWAVCGAPRLHRLVPWFGQEGDPILLEGFTGTEDRAFRVRGRIKVQALE